MYRLSAYHKQSSLENQQKSQMMVSLVEWYLPAILNICCLLDFFCGNPNERVRLKLLVQLAEQLTSNSCFKLKFFIAKLDFEREDLEQFLKYTSDVQEQCFDVLTTWQKRAGDQATIGNLRDALRQAASWFFTDADTVEASTCADQPKALQDDTQALSLPIHVQQDGLRTSVTTEVRSFVL